MTVYAWDGHHVAADKQATMGGARLGITKIRRIGDKIVVGAGSLSGLIIMFNWIENGEDFEQWPESQKDSDNSAYMLVVPANDKPYRYESLPARIPIEDPFFAGGDGGQFAWGALAAGATAKEAVEIAVKYAEGCGVGIDVMGHE